MYDNLNQLRQEIRLMGEVTRYWYNDAGNLEEKQDANGQRIEYIYEPETELLQEIRHYDSADTQTRLISFNYDERSGLLTGYDDGTTSAVYTYDDRGRKFTETVNYPSTLSGVEGFSKTFRYSYDAVGLKRSFTIPDGPTYSYTHDAAKQLKNIRIPGVGTISYPSYTMGRPDSVTFPGGSTQTYQYDALMRVERITAPDMDYQYTSYDNLSNILTKTTEHGNYTYAYDDVSRLTSADNPAVDDDAFTYDGVGNRETASNVTTGMITHNDNNELTLYGDITYDYDANGNMIRKSLGTAAIIYTYDVANRLVKVEDEAAGTAVAEYYYDPFGRRLWKDVGGTRTYFLCADEGLAAEYDETGAEIRSYGYQPHSTWTTNPLWLKEDGTYYWYQNDHLGTPQKLIAQDGTVVWSAQYTAFGEAHVEVETVVNNLRFPGQWHDAETGLHYNFHRYYDPKIGRYLRVDPIGFLAGSANLYRYVGNNPIQVDDPFGLSNYKYIEEGKLEYSCKCGWIDWTHASHTVVDRLLWSGEEIGPPRGEMLLSKARKTHYCPEGGFKVTQRQFASNDTLKLKAGYGRSYWVPVFLKSRPRSQQEAAAFFIFREVESGFEGKFQGGPVVQISGSSFSEEDLPSFWIGFYMNVKQRALLEYAEQHDLLSKKKDKTLRNAIRHICGVPADALNVSKAVWTAHKERTGRGLGKNPAWKPVNHNADARAYLTEASGKSFDCCQDPGTPYLEWPEMLNTISLWDFPGIRPWIVGYDSDEDPDLGRHIMFGNGLLYLYDKTKSEYYDILPQINIR